MDSMAEAYAILFGLGRVTVSRPLTHDLFLTMANKLQLKLVRAEIWNLKNNTFYGRLIYTGGTFTAKKPLVLDARPSDALALAVRNKSPILIARKVIDETGLPIDFFLDLNIGSSRESTPGAEKNTPVENSRQETLLRELEQAVEAEEYERAAKIRDMLSDKNISDKDN